MAGIVRAFWMAWMMVSLGCGPSYVCPQSFSAARGDDILGRYATQQRALKSVLGTARIEHIGEKGRIRGTVMFAATEDGRLRFDVMTQLGPVATLTFDGKTVNYWDREEGRFMRSGPCREGLEWMLGVPLTADDLARAFLGAPPEGFYSASDGVCGSEGLVIEKFDRERNTKQSLTFAVRKEQMAKPKQQQSLELREARYLDPSHKRNTLIRFSNYEPVEGNAILPRRVHVVDEAQHVDLLIRVKDADVNSQPGEEMFQQQVPGGMDIQVYACDVEPL